MVRLFDTMSRQELPLEAADGRTLRMYCCGPTVYGPAHIGNFRTFVLQDVLRRVVELSGLPVCHVRNVTDVDDKTIGRAQAEGKALEVVTREWTERFHADARALNLLPPHVEPAATAHVAEQIAMVRRLVEGGHAYVAGDGSVYFRVSSFGGYGRLSRVAERELRPGAVLQRADEYDKETIADFALWKAWKEEDGANGWESPWGRGRPGWHLECSAMSLRYLGENFDLHSGGVDLCFPHHENEIAQAEAATGRTFCRHWFHIAHLLVDGGKMSKSLGNLYTVDDVRARGWTPAEMRQVLLSGHYRKPLDFRWDSLRAARSALQRVAVVRRRLESAGQQWPGYAELVARGPGDLREFSGVWEALCDDLNTPAALGAFFEGLGGLEGGAGDAPEGALGRMAFCAAALGWELAVAGEGQPDIPAEIRVLAERRWQARLAKDWAASDVLRGELAALGWEAKDGKAGYELKRKA